MHPSGEHQVPTVESYRSVLPITMPGEMRSRSTHGTDGTPTILQGRWHPGAQRHGS